MSIRVFVNGALGHMGKVLTQYVLSFDSEFAMAGGLDVVPGEYPARLFQSFSEISPDFDVLIDFSVPTASLQALSYCVENSKPCVIATTGFSDEQINIISHASKSIPVFFTGNMSLGVNLQVALAQKAAEVLGENYDVEIIETHHNLKKDAPSGTAYMLANAINDVFSGKKQYVYGRYGSSAKRSSKEIGIHSLRGGSICGEHTVRFLGADEEVSITHRAYSKLIFAKGALKAASFIVNCSPGLYDMRNILN